MLAIAYLRILVWNYHDEPPHFDASGAKCDCKKWRFQAMEPTLVKKKVAEQMLEILENYDTTEVNMDETFDIDYHEPGPVQAVEDDAVNSDEDILPWTDSSPKPQATIFIRQWQCGQFKRA